MIDAALLTKHAGGRPSIYKPSMIPQLIELMSEGRGVIETATELGVTVETLYDWTDEQSTRFKPELSSALKLGRQLYETWWTNQGRVNLENPKFNHVLWYMQMKNRFAWRDQVDITTDGQPIAFVNSVPRPVIEAETT